MRTVVALDRQNIDHLADEDLLELGVEVRLRLFDEDEMQGRPVLFDVHPLRMEIK